MDWALQAPVDISGTYNWVPVTWKHPPYAPKDHLVNAVYGSSRYFMSMVRRPLFGQHFKSIRLKVVPVSTQLAIIHKPPMLWQTHGVDIVVLCFKERKRWTDRCGTLRSHVVCHLLGDLHSLFCVATHYKLDGLVFEPGRTLDATLPHVLWVPALFHGGKAAQAWRWPPGPH
jgi:hypothetical protein